MGVYLFLIFAAAALAAVMKMATGNNYKRGVYLFIIFFALIFVSCFRKDTVGGDLQNYIPLFESAKYSSWSEYLSLPKYGFIFLIYNKLLCSIGDNYTVLLIGTSLFNLIAVAVFVKRYSLIPWLSIVMYICMGFYGRTFNSLRSSMALAILLYSIPFILERKFLKFLIVYICAFIVHKSVFPFFVAYFFARRRLPLKIMVPVAAFLFVAASELSPLLNSILVLYDPSYIGSETSGGGYAYFMILVAIAIFCNVFKNKYESPANALLFNMLVVGMCIQPFASQISYINRIVIFFTIALIIVIPNSVATIKSKDLRLLVESALLICFVAYFVNVDMRIDPATGTNNQAVIPYLFAWQ